MARKPKPAPGLPSRQQILDFIKESPTPVGKREIARAFGITVRTMQEHMQLSFGVPLGTVGQVVR